MAEIETQFFFFLLVCQGCEALVSPLTRKQKSPTIKRRAQARRPARGAPTRPKKASAEKLESPNRQRSPFKAPRAQRTRETAKRSFDREALVPERETRKKQDSEALVSVLLFVEFCATGCALCRTREGQSKAERGGAVARSFRAR